MKKLNKKTQQIVEGSPFYHIGYIRGMIMNMPKSEILDYFNDLDYQETIKWRDEVLEHLKKVEELINKTI
jgi:hypothetical protein